MGMTVVHAEEGKDMIDVRVGKDAVVVQFDSGRA